MADWLQLAQGCLQHILKAQIPPQDILKPFISKSLGMGIIAGACVTKVPQILAVSGSKSATGLSALSFELESLGLMIHTSYGALTGLPFSAYGEAAVLCAQSLLLLAMIYKYSKASASRIMAVISILSAFAASVVTGRVSQDMIKVAFDANNLIMMASRLPQIYSNWSTKATGQLSIITCAINTVGCVVRIFTSITENAGPAMVRGYILSLVLNATLVLQILMYAKNTKAAASKKSKAVKAKKQQ